MTGPYPGIRDAIAVVQDGPRLGHPRLGWWVGAPRPESDTRGLETPLLAASVEGGRVNETRDDLSAVSVPSPAEPVRQLSWRSYATARLAEWAHLDVTVQHTPGAAPGNGLVLVAHPPAAGTLAGRIELHLDGTEVGAATASPCGSCPDGQPRPRPRRRRVPAPRLRPHARGGRGGPGSGRPATVTRCAT